jgi:hypothetical protein
MRHASLWTSIESSTPDISRTPSTTKSLFAWLLEALHHSRRLQAQRALGQYRHLIVRPETAGVRRNTAGENNVGH